MVINNMQDAINFLRKIREINGLTLFSDEDYADMGRVIKFLESEKAQKYSDKIHLKHYLSNITG